MLQKRNIEIKKLFEIKNMKGGINNKKVGRENIENFL